MGATHQKSFQVNVNDEDDDGEDHGDDGDEDGDESDDDGNEDDGDDVRDGSDDFPAHSLLTKATQTPKYGSSSVQFWNHFCFYTMRISLGQSMIQNSKFKYKC